MRYHWLLAILAGAALVATGCVPTDGSGGLLGTVTNLLGGNQDTGDPQADPGAAQTIGESTVITGSVGSGGDYRLFDLGAVSYGAEWRITPSNPLGADVFLVVLLDADYNLLYRQQVSRYSPLDHTFRFDAPQVFAGVAAAYGRNGGGFSLAVSRRTAATVIGPRQQVVWVNFGGGSGVRVHQRSGLSFPAFDATLVDGRYEGQTDALKAAIMSAVRADYAGYDIVILSSDEAPAPAGTYATIHLGGDDSRLLGLADNVDQYNTDLGQAAIVFVESFGLFSSMRLTVDQMGQMIGNTVSHELGHLLGLFHTSDPADLMDTTGTAWDLTRDQAFIRGPLESSVFPVGYEDCPARLAETLGYQPEAAKPDTASSRKQDSRLRAIIHSELRCRCGNCLNPDE